LLEFADTPNVSRPIEYDRTRLHALLFYRADNRGVIAINQLTLAAETGISQFHFNRIMQEFIEEGRLQRIGRPIKHRKLQTFNVSDPRSFSTDRGDIRGAQNAEYAMEILEGANLKRPQASPNKELQKLIHRQKTQPENEQEEIVSNAL
jgi:hypothetical protein